jgi:hypothetical protein
MSFLRLWFHAAARAFQGRRGAVLLGLSALPVVVAWVIAHRAHHVGERHFLGVQLLFVFQFVVPLAGLFLGVAVLGDEIEGRTLTYLFTRPQPRPLVLLARYAGLCTAFLVPLVATVVVTALVFATRVKIPEWQILSTAGIAVLGFLTYAAVFAMLRLFVNRALFVGFILVFILEGFVSKIPKTGLSSCTVWHHLALLESRLFQDQVLWDAHFRKLLRGISPDETVARSLWVLAAILLVSLVVASVRVRVQETRLANASS